jgi:hypothetical protein
VFHPWTSFRSLTVPSLRPPRVAAAHRATNLHQVARGEARSEDAWPLTACWSVSQEGRLCCEWTVPAPDFPSISAAA